jgi:hypothetical protein
MQVQRQTRLWVLLAASLATSAALAEGPVSPTQMRAETAAAVAAGTIPRGEAGAMMSRAGAMNSMVARGDVRSETMAALRAGELARGESHAFATPMFASERSRAEVKAETMASLRLGLVPHGQAPMRDATMAEQEQVRLAVEDARHAPTAVAGKTRRFLFN